MGKKMIYRGKDAKMTAQPSASEYITLKPQGSASRRVRLSGRYQLQGDGLYYVRVRNPADGHIRYRDVMRTETKIMIKGTEEHEARYQAKAEERLAEAKMMLEQARLVEGGVAYSYQGCSSAQQTALTGWHADGKHKITSSLACTESSCATLVDTWFGASTAQSQFMAVTEEFTRMQNVYENTIYVCQGSEGPCSGGNVFAYVYPTDSSQRVHICDFTFNYPDYSERVQTVLHELSHFNHIGSTNDNAYGERTCINLAQSNFQAALQTADSTAYFATASTTYATCFHHRHCWQLCTVGEPIRLRCVLYLIYRRRSVHCVRWDLCGRMISFPSCRFQWRQLLQVLQ